MDISEIIFLSINVFIALGVLIIATKQLKDSRQGTLIGAINILRSIQEEELSKLSTLMELPTRQLWLETATDDVRKRTCSDLEKTLTTLHQLNDCYNVLINKLDKELSQKGVLATALRKQKDTNPDKILKIFKKAVKL